MPSVGPLRLRLRRSHLPLRSRGRAQRKDEGCRLERCPTGCSHDDGPDQRHSQRMSDHHLDGTGIPALVNLARTPEKRDAVQRGESSSLLCWRPPCTERAKGDRSSSKRHSVSSACCMNVGRNTSANCPHREGDHQHSGDHAKTEDHRATLTQRTLQRSIRMVAVP